MASEGPNKSRMIRQDVDVAVPATGTAAVRLIQRLISSNDEASEGEDKSAFIMDEMREFLLKIKETGPSDRRSIETTSEQRDSPFQEENKLLLNTDTNSISKPQLLSFGSGGEKIVLKSPFSKIDLSSHAHIIGDVGCAALCSSLTTVHCPSSQNQNQDDHNSMVANCVHALDLEANGISFVGASVLATVLLSNTPCLVHLNLGCNTIGTEGAQVLASMLYHCPRLSTIDLHGNAIGNSGCVALGSAFLEGAVPLLQDLDLSANRIQDSGCAALASLFRCCPMLTHLNLNENGIESISMMLRSDHDVTLPLESLDLSWNCIRDFRVLEEALAENRFPRLEELCLKGNSLPDAQCDRFCAALVANFSAPLLYRTDNKHSQIDSVEHENAVDKTHSSQLGEGHLRSCLRLLADGHATNSHVCKLDLWKNRDTRLVKGLPKELVEEDSKVEDYTSNPLHGETVKASAFDLLRRDGFVLQPPITSLQEMTRIENTMERIESAGWPPVFCFMNDDVWDLVATRVFPLVRKLLGVDSVLDSGSAFAWSLKATGKSTFPRDGEFRSWQNAVSSINPTIPKERGEDEYRGFASNFGLPHRDYSAGDSLHRDESESVSDHPAILNVWIPLNDATLNNGCIYVVPREFDANFSRTDVCHAHMNPATEVQRGVSSKIHFPFMGDTVQVLETTASVVVPPEGGPPRIHNPSPPLTVAQARTMTPAMRLALISRSLLLYNQWHALADDAVPSLIYETTTIPQKNQQLPGNGRFCSSTNY